MLPDYLFDADTYVHSPKFWVHNYDFKISDYSGK